MEWQILRSGPENGKWQTLWYCNCNSRVVTCDTFVSEGLTQIWVDNAEQLHHRLVQRLRDVHRSQEYKDADDLLGCVDNSVFQYKPIWTSRAHTRPFWNLPATWKSIRNLVCQATQSRWREDQEIIQKSEKHKAKYDYIINNVFPTDLRHGTTIIFCVFSFDRMHQCWNALGVKFNKWLEYFVSMYWHFLMTIQYSTCILNTCLCRH